jgi:hypothetical protein
MSVQGVTPVETKSYDQITNHSAVSVQELTQKAEAFQRSVTEQAQRDDRFQREMRVLRVQSDQAAASLEESAAIVQYIERTTREVAAQSNQLYGSRLNKPRTVCQYIADRIKDVASCIYEIFKTFLSCITCNLIKNESQGDIYVSNGNNRSSDSSRLYS